MGERDDFSAFLIGFIIGGLTGAAISLLLAPQSGEATRSFIKDKAIELGDKASETAEKTYSQAEEVALEARARADKFAKIAKERADELQQRGQVMMEEQKNKISNAIETARKSGKPQETGGTTNTTEA